MKKVWGEIDISPQKKKRRRSKSLSDQIVATQRALWDRNHLGVSHHAGINYTVHNRFSHLSCENMSRLKNLTSVAHGCKNSAVMRTRCLFPKLPSNNMLLYSEKWLHCKTNYPNQSNFWETQMLPRIVRYLRITRHSSEDNLVHFINRHSHQLSPIEPSLLGVI